MIALAVLLAPLAYLVWKWLPGNTVNTVASATPSPATRRADCPTSWTELDERQLNRLLDGG